MEKRDGKLKWYSLIFMAFCSVWSFGNLTTGFVYFNGIQAIFSWVVIFALYFVPYVLMVGELGSAFKDEGSGVSAWIYRTSGAKLAYFAGWTYWACHVVYISNRSSISLKALSWTVFRNAETYDSFPIISVQIATLVTLLFGCFIASRGFCLLKRILTFAGMCIFVMSFLYIVMMFAAPIINPSVEYVRPVFNWKNLIPEFNFEYFGILSILVFAVGGCEKISPYVNKVEDPSRGFPLSMFFLAGIVVICAVLGSVAMSRMFDPAVINSSQEVFDSYVANSAYWAFQKLGQYYHLGDLFLILYSVCNCIINFSVLVLSIDAPLRMLLDNEEIAVFIPSGFRKVNSNGAYINGILFVAILSGSIIAVQACSTGAASVLRQLMKLNSVCMPMRYLWVFFAYLALRRSYDTIHAEYRFAKSQPVAVFWGWWCFAVTLVCCIMGIYDKDPLTFVLNLVTPCTLFLLGIIMPYIAERERKHR